MKRMDPAFARAAGGTGERSRVPADQCCETTPLCGDSCMMYRYLLIAFLCVSLVPALSRGQERRVAFRQLLSEPALTATTVSWITQDRTGYLWLATENGLFKYDGYSFVHYQSDANDPGSIPAKLLLAVCTDKKGQLWVSSLSGLCRYHADRDDFSRYYPDGAAAPGVKGNFIHRTVEDRWGNLWLATNNGLYTFHPPGKNFVQLPVAPAGPEGRPNPAVRSLLVDRRGTTIWAGTEAGLSRIDLPSRKVTRYLHEPADPNSLGNNVVRSVYEDRQGTIWVGTEGGLNQLDPATGRFRRHCHQPRVPGSLSSDTVLTVLEDKAGRLWIGTYNGLNIREPGQENFTAYFNNPYDPESISGNTVTALFADRTGIMWVGTNRGVARVTADFNGFRRYFYNRTPTKRNDCHVTALLEEANDVYWLGTGNHLVRFDKARDTYRYYPLPATPRARGVSSLARGKAGTLWIGSAGGLFVLRPGEREISSFRGLDGQDIWTLCLDKTGVLWIGTANGLYSYQPDTGRLAHFRHHAGNPFSLSKDMVGVVLEDRQGTLWVGTAQGGLNRLDRKTGRFHHYRHSGTNPATLSSDTVAVLFEDTRGGLWVGTGKGLDFFDKERGVVRRYPAHHPVRQEISGILEDDHHNLWISHREGISKFNIRTGSVKDYGVSDGVQTDYSSDYLRNTQGEMIFSGSDGLTVFHPDSIRDSQPAPPAPVVVTGFYLFNKPIAPGDKVLPTSIADTRSITLNHDQSIFAFEFSALHFSNPEKQQYAYMLEGLEKDWNYASNRRYASYSNIPAGKTYTFRVKAADDGGGWRTPETSIRIRIVPPFWQTWWFRAALAASLLGGVGVIYCVRERQHRRRQQALEERVALRTVQISRQKEHIEQQAAEIDRINQLLRHDNRQLSENVKDLSQARVMQKRVTFEEFRQIYPDEEACLKFIAELKWKDGYGCGKCGNTTYAPGPVAWSRRCSRCSTIERATTGTLFCRVRFPITKGFYMLFLLSQGKPLTVDELSEILLHPRQTCWAFRKKVLEAMEAAGNSRRSQDGWSYLIFQG